MLQTRYQQILDDWRELFPRKPLPKLTSFEQDSGAPDPGGDAAAGGDGLPTLAAGQPTRER